MYAAMAGNIIPAIATTNAVIAGLIVMEALKILGNNFDKCSTVSFFNFLNFTILINMPQLVKIFLGLCCSIEF